MSSRPAGGALGGWPGHCSRVLSFSHCPLLLLALTSIVFLSHPPPPSAVVECRRLALVAPGTLEKPPPPPLDDAKHHVTPTTADATPSPQQQQHAQLQESSSSSSQTKKISSSAVTNTLPADIVNSGDSNGQVPAAATESPIHKPIFHEAATTTTTIRNIVEETTPPLPETVTEWPVPVVVVVEEPRDVTEEPLQQQPAGATTSVTLEHRDDGDQSTVAPPVKHADTTPQDPSHHLQTQPPPEAVETTTQPAPPATTDAPEIPCETVCLNEGKCVRLKDGQEICVCPSGFFGTRCQLRDICATVIADSLTGEQICARLGTICHRDDKLFRCRCQSDEYFVFKADYHARAREPADKSPAVPLPTSAALDLGPGGGSRTPSAIQEATSRGSSSSSSSFTYDSLLPLVAPPDDEKRMGGSQQSADNSQQAAPHHPARASASATRKTFYLAECRKIDKCVGVRCRQMSERCVRGECHCNRNLGYIRDPRDNLCKLLDPCRLPTPDGRPLCGQAKCVATYDRDLYHCVCPVGYNIVQKGPERSSTQCGLLFNTICDIPLLNRCQHVCRVDQKANTYRCSCLPGYTQGTKPGLDDHLCFFDEFPSSGGGGGGSSDSSGDSSGGWRHAAKQHTRTPRASEEGGGGAQQEEGHTPRVRFFALSRAPEHPAQHAGARPARRTLVIRREIQALPPPPNSSNGGDESRWLRTSTLPVTSGATSEPEARGRVARKATSDGDYETMDDLDYGGEMSQLSAQDRCNMYCEQNKICVLEEGSTDSYRCVCDRQGYVSVGDKCLDWCAAAEFSHGVQSLLDEVCYSGLCRRRRHESTQTAAAAAAVAAPLGAWRPTFECDCSGSPVMFKDPATHLCQLDFEAILKPCQPGQEGHTDCVVNKHAYCAVLHRSAQSLYRDLKSDADSSSSSSVGVGAQSKQSSGAMEQQKQQQQQLSPAAQALAAAAAKKLKASLKEKPYTCVCSPEKKFLVDKPRNKARCIDECDLLNSECGRFNRMCRAPSVESNDDFGYRVNLVRLDRDGVRMNQFRRTGCECLPGFNVGPREARDFTLDDNDLDDGQIAGLGSSGGGGGGGVRAPIFTSGLPLDSALGPQQPPLEWLTSGTGSQPVGAGALLEGGDFTPVPYFDHPRAPKYMNINSRCLLDYDVVEFHARFKAPADFEPAWVRVRNPTPTSVPGPPAAPGLARPVATPGGEISPPPSDGADEPPPPPPPPPNATAPESPAGRSSENGDKQQQQQADPPPDYEETLLRVPEFMRVDISEFYKHVVLVAQCDHSMAQLSGRAFEACIRYRYWVVHKLRTNFADWRQVMTASLRDTFDLMEGNIRFRVNKCESTIRRVTTLSAASSVAPNVAPEVPATIQPPPPGPPEASADKSPPGGATGGRQPDHHLRRSHSNSKVVLVAEPGAPTRGHPEEVLASEFDPLDQQARVDADVDCELTIHSASGDDDDGAAATRRHVRKVLLEKQLPRFIFGEPTSRVARVAAAAAAEKPTSAANNKSPDQAPRTSSPLEEPSTQLGYYLMAPRVLIARDSYDRLATHRKLFSPCRSDYAYCDKQTRCEMVDSVNYTCTCEAGYTPIGSRDIYLGDSRKEVCEDINECLFDVCKLNGLENKSVCVNEIGDYKCQCIRHHVGDNKRYCNHICNVIACKHGDCRIPDEHHAFCECHEGYREPDCSVQDPSVALRKANMIICGSIFASVLLLAITLAISLNSQLKKTKKKLKRLEAAHEAVEFYEFSLQQPPYRQRVSKASTGS